MTVQHLNAVKSIARTAQTSGAQMPEHISDALRHLDELAAAQSAPFQPGASAKEIAKHLGDRTAMEKATKAASIRLATDEARLRIERHLVEVCATRILGMMHGSSEQISAAFGVALADELDTLSHSAAKLPVYFRREDAASLDPARFTAWTEARDAYARIQSTPCAGAVVRRSDHAGGGATVPHRCSPVAALRGAAEVQHSKRGLCVSGRAGWTH